ncbi:13208_t:CDS:2 [Funneliformis geosporum]|uniref:9606_t:CDS:1 n=1 Tax=Funneliformis geosporum TaxID=1117311 RepID=A0A9W4SDG6_9GLOM|nr:9606_t:CDS:2 [Funneliformis geosporum]CAI2171230.1 13208_t:CDS:2 [Funneliformis geosporum]
MEEQHEKPLLNENDFQEDNFEIDEDASRCSNGIIKSENEKEIDIKMCLHDFDIEFQVFDNILVIFGKWKPIDGEIVPPVPQQKGRRYQSFVRPISLPANVNTEKIHKLVEDGVIHVKVPKNGNPDRNLEAGYCALCKFRESLNKHFPGLSELFPKK